MAQYLNGGFGNDIFVYVSATESSGINFDTIQVFDSRSDKIDLAGAVSGWTGKVTTGRLSNASFDSDVAAAINGILEANSAVLYQPDAGDFVGRTFAIIDRNGDSSYQSGLDIVIEFHNPLMPLDISISYFI